jgi:hypothetical protein
MDPQQTDSYFPPMPTPSSTNPLNATSMNLQQTECGVPYAETLYLTRVDAIRAYALEHPRTTEGFQKGDLIPESLLSTFHKNFMRQAYEVAIKRNWSSLHAEVYADGALIKLLCKFHNCYTGKLLTATGGEEALGFHDLKGRNWTLVELLQLLGFPSADRQAQYMLESAFDSPDFILPMFRRLLTSNLHPDFWWQQTFGKMSISSHAVQVTTQRYQFRPAMDA